MAKIIERNKKLTKLHNYKAKINNDERFECVIAPVIFIAQIFGFFPINRLCSKNINNVTFKWISFATFYTGIWFFCSSLCTWFEMRRAFRDEYHNLKSFGGTIYYTSNWIFAILLLRLAKSFPEILRRWYLIEEKFLSEPYSASGISLKKWVRRLSLVLLIFGTLEHMLSHTSFLNDRYIQATTCNWTIGDTAGYIITTHLSHIFAVIPYHLPIGIWAEFINTSITVVWNFVDLVIIVFSCGIAFQFKQINYRLSFFKGRVISEKTWEEVRLHYVSVCELQEFIDSHLAIIIVMASLNDLYSVCSQFLNIAIKFPYPINTIYFWYSFLYLTVRTLGLFLVASTIHEESKLPLRIFRSIPTEGWFSETERFCQQVQSETIAFTGMNFFSLTRSLIISIAGTIVTYELVLLQFDAEKVEPGMFNPCGH